MTPPDVMGAEEARAWLAGAQAARAADVAEVRRLAGGHSAAVRWYCAETTAAAPEWSERADYEARASATLQGAGDALAALPLPPPPQTAPAPPQSPPPSPDGGTGPQGDGAPAGGLSVAAGDGPTVEAWRVVVEGEGDEGPEVWPVEVWREGDGWACEDILAATRRSRGPTPEAAILRRTVFRAGARLRELVPPGMRTSDERVAHALASRGDAAAFVEAAAVCGRMAQSYDRLAAAASPSADPRPSHTASALHLAADRIRALAGGL